MKLMMLVVLVTSCFLIGHNFCIRSKTRLEQLKEFRKTMYLLDKEMEYSMDNMSAALERIISKCDNGAVKDFFVRVREGLDRQLNMEVAWEEALGCSGLMLDGNVRTDVLSLGKCIGYMNLDNNSNMIKLLIESLDMVISAGSEKIANEVKVYHTVSLAVGLYLAIIFA